MAGNHGGSHGEHVPGTMDVSVQEKTFDGFIRMVTRATIVIIALLIFTALVNA
jgi:hypothetical protein